MRYVALSSACFFCLGVAKRLNIAGVKTDFILGRRLRTLEAILLALSQTHIYHARHSPVRRSSSLLLSESAGPDPEDWRAFRAKLISGVAFTDEANEPTKKQQDAKSPRVASGNEKLLQNQSHELWTEYMQGAWAHEIPLPEVGGLIVQMPLPTQMIRRMQENPDGSALAKRLYDRLSSEFPSDNASSNPSESIEAWSSNTLRRTLMYRLAEKLILDKAEELKSKADSRGRVVFDSLPADTQEFVSMFYSDVKKGSQQAVALVVNNSMQGTVTSLKLNQPCALNIDRDDARLLINGYQNLQNGIQIYDDDFLDQFLKAFGESVAIYAGGPDNKLLPATLIHGFNLTGASEIAPGARIFQGGVESAVAAVLSGERSPLDFRWFIGAQLDESFDPNRWWSIACARAIALKQCIQLPKPLWHEVLELCEGELAEISQREITKRTDLDLED